jgi:hypothetical protein
MVCGQSSSSARRFAHEGWDETAKRAIDRFTAAAVSEDVATDLDLLGTDYSISSILTIIRVRRSSP